MPLSASKLTGSGGCSPRNQNCFGWVFQPSVMVMACLRTLLPPTLPARGSRCVCAAPDGTTRERRKTVVDRGVVGHRYRGRERLPPVVRRQHGGHEGQPTLGHLRQ